LPKSIAEQVGISRERVGYIN